MSLTLPSNPTRTNCDAGTDDPKQALLADLYNHIGTTIDFLAAMGNLATKQYGNGLAVETQGASTADKVHVAIATLAKTAAYTAVAADRGKLIDCTSGTFTLSLTAAATLGDGWFCWARNSGTGLITIDPNAAEMIDGQTTLILPPGFCGLIQCTGSAFKTSLISINLLTALTAPAVDDELTIYDLSATTASKITLANLFKVIDSLTAETAPATGDELVLYDVSASTADKITLENVLKVINSLTEDTSPDGAADFVLTYDTSASAVKKAKPDNLFSGFSTDAGANAVGMICLAVDGAQPTASGATVAGSSLTATIFDSATGLLTTYGGGSQPLSGTWRNVGAYATSSTYNTAWFQRIS